MARQRMELFRQKKPYRETRPAPESAPSSTRLAAKLTGFAVVPILRKCIRAGGAIGPQAPVAQLDRATAYGAVGWGFESLQAYWNLSHLIASVDISSQGDWYSGSSCSWLLMDVNGCRAAFCAFCAPDFAPVFVGAIPASVPVIESFYSMRSSKLRGVPVGRRAASSGG